MDGLAEAADGGGLGWALTLFDAIASEYHWKEKKILKTPLSRILAYFAAICLRSGNQADGPTYEEQDLADDLTGVAGGDE
jgi:hypothetical protein